MERSWLWCCLAVVLVLFAYPAAFSTSIYDGGVSLSSFSTRRFLRLRKACGFDLYGLNYTIVISECKGPQYPKYSCCEAFKKLACPFAEQLNDVTTMCAPKMFSLLHLFGQYPPGLFSEKCKPWIKAEGLRCPDPSETTTDTGDGQ